MQGSEKILVAEEQGGSSLAHRGRWPEGGVSGTADPLASASSLLSVVVASRCTFLVEKRQITLSAALSSASSFVKYI